MKDLKNYELFTKQVDILDVMWIDEETGFALCDDGGDDDAIYLIKDTQPFEFVKVVERNKFTKLFVCLCEQFAEMIKKGKK